MTRNILFSALALLLAACAIPAKSIKLYRLTPLADNPVETSTSMVVAVERLQAPAALDTPRIALTCYAIDFDYFAGPEWVDNAPAMLQRLIIESLDGSNGMVAIDAHGTTAIPDERLRLDLRTFQAEYGKDREAPTAHVRLSVKRLDPKTMAILDSRTFDARIPASANTQRAIVEAFNSATTEVLDNLRNFATLKTP